MQLMNILVGLVGLNAISAIALPAPEVLTLPPTRITYHEHPHHPAPNAIAEAEAAPIAAAADFDDILDKRDLVARAEQSQNWNRPQGLTFADDDYYYRPRRRGGHRGGRRRLNDYYYSDNRRFNRRRYGQNRQDPRLIPFARDPYDDRWDW